MEEIRGVELAAYDEGKSDDCSEVPDECCTFEKVCICKALLEGAVDKDVMLVRLGWVGGCCVECVERLGRCSPFWVGKGSEVISASLALLV